MAFPNVSEQVWTVYRITCVPSGRLYIGITNGALSTRWSNHVSASSRDETGNGILGRSIRKYGRENFVVDTLYHATSRREAAAVEKGLIASYGTLCPNGMNMTSGGEGTADFRSPHSPETKLKMSAAAKGKKKTPEARQKMSEWRIGRPMPDSVRAKIAQTMAGRAPTPYAIERGRVAALERAKKWREENPRVRVKRVSGIKGICWDSAKSRWLVTIWADKKTRVIGRYKDIEDAKRANSEARHQYALSLKNPTSQP